MFGGLCLKNKQLLLVFLFVGCKRTNCGYMNRQFTFKSDGYNKWGRARENCWV